MTGPGGNNNKGNSGSFGKTEHVDFDDPLFVHSYDNSVTTIITIKLTTIITIKLTDNKNYQV